MSRALIALLLVASLVSGVFFFTPNNSAEYDYNDSDDSNDSDENDEQDYDDKKD